MSTRRRNCCVRVVHVVLALLLVVTTAPAFVRANSDSVNSDNAALEHARQPFDAPPLVLSAVQPSDAHPPTQQQQQLADQNAPATALDTSLSFDAIVQSIATIDWTALLDVTQYELPTFSYETDWHAIATTLHAASVGTIECLRLWLAFVLVASVPIVHLLSALVDALLPHAMTLLGIGVTYVQAMDPVHQAVVGFILVTIAIGIRCGVFHAIRLQYRAFKRSIELRYRSFLASLSHTSRVVAVLLPHVAFFASAYVLFGLWAPDAIVSVWQNDALSRFFATGYPLLRTILIIRHRRLSSRTRENDSLVVQSAQATDASNSSSSTRRRNVATATTAAPTSRPTRSRSIEELVWSEWRPYETILKYWVLWSLAVCMHSLTTLFVPQVLLSYVTLPPLVCNVALAWIHSPVTRGDIALYTLWSPVVHPMATRLRASVATVSSGTNTQEANFVMRTLVLLRIVPERHIDFVQDLWAQGPALSGLLFLFTPGFVTTRGCLLVGFGFPAYKTMGELAAKQTRRYEWWLSYFCVAVALEYVVAAIAAELSWLPFVAHLKLLLLLWLQFPYFCGAQRLFDASFASVFVIPGRQRRDE